MDKKKRLKKIRSLEEQKEKHRDKIASYEGKDYNLVDYWEREIARMDKDIEEEKSKL
ncbi:MAG: hypothetical protein AABX48_02690 [Nanoarchaeota archaeon]|nr:hypothetical protein [Nanoarchaeota archaeon]